MAEVAKDRKGNVKKEYPKLVMTDSGKVRVNNKKEEDALNLPKKEEKKEVKKQGGSW